MDNNRVIGSAKQAEGPIKDPLGQAAGAAKRRADGKVQNAIGGVKDARRGAVTQ